jgi:metallo-beta-lactamase family protein
MEYQLEAEVVTLNGFSNHADQPGLLGWAQAFKSPPERTFVVHGDPDAADELATRLRRDLGFQAVTVPTLHQTVEI